MENLYCQGIGMLKVRDTDTSNESNQHVCTIKNDLFGTFLIPN